MFLNPPVPVKRACQGQMHVHDAVEQYHQQSAEENAVHTGKKAVTVLHGCAWLPTLYEQVVAARILLDAEDQHKALKGTLRWTHLDMSCPLQQPLVQLPCVLPIALADLKVDVRLHTPEKRLVCSCCRIQWDVPL